MKSGASRRLPWLSEVGRLALRPEVFAILAPLIKERTGIHFAPSEIDILADKLSPRVIDAGFDSMLDYYYFIRYDDADGREFVALTDALLIHETYFFRELEPLRMAMSSLVEPAARAGRRPRIWSAACATGEEPLTLAMLAADCGILPSVEIVASDLSARALERAQRSDFNRRSLRSVPNGGLAEKYLERDGERMRVRADLARAISWRQINLVTPPPVEETGVFDLICCRNVLIYFSEDTISQVLHGLAARLAPTGMLLVGVSESLLRFGSLFRCEERGGVFFYQKGAL